MQQNHYQHLAESFRPVSEIAVAYFPNYEHARSAIRKFRCEVEKDSVLKAGLTEAGYTPTALQLSPRQIKIIFERWGVPGPRRLPSSGMTDL